MGKMQMEIAFDSETTPLIPMDAIVRVDPIVGESGYVAAFRLIDDRDGNVIATVPASQVTINGKKGARVRLAHEGEETWRPEMGAKNDLRERLVSTALDWQSIFGIAPHITSAISEYDAARLMGMTDTAYASEMRKATAVRKGHDFRHESIRYQIKANRPSGKPGSKVTRVAKAKNYDWDKLIWIHYTEKFDVQEAWLWDVADYKAAFDAKPRLSPNDYRRGTRLA